MLTRQQWDGEHNREAGCTMRYDFPSEVVEERRRVYARVRELLFEQTTEALQEANCLHLNWLERYPDDAVALDAGEVLAMSLSAEKRAEV